MTLKVIFKRDPTPLIFEETRKLHGLIQVGSTSLKLNNCSNIVKIGQT